MAVTCDTALLSHPCKFVLRMLLKVRWLEVVTNLSFECGLHRLVTLCISLHEASIVLLVQLRLTYTMCCYLCVFFCHLELLDHWVYPHSIEHATAFEMTSVGKTHQKSHFNPTADIFVYWMTCAWVVWDCFAI